MRGIAASLYGRHPSPRPPPNEGERCLAHTAIGEAMRTKLAGFVRDAARQRLHRRAGGDARRARAACLAGGSECIDAAGRRFARSSPPTTPTSSASTKSSPPTGPGTACGARLQGDRRAECRQRSAAPEAERRRGAKEPGHARPRRARPGDGDAGRRRPRPPRRRVACRGAGVRRHPPHRRPGRDRRDACARRAAGEDDARAARPPRAGRAGAGRRLDLRRTIHRSISHGGTPVELAWRRRKPKPLRLVVLLDASGSMSLYTAFFVRFLHGVVDAFREAEAFVFHTRLAHVSPSLRDRNVTRAVEKLSLMAQGIGGGTRIGESLATFNRWHAKRVINSRTVRDDRLRRLRHRRAGGARRRDAAAAPPLPAHRLAQPADRLARLQPGRARHAGGAADRSTSSRRRTISKALPRSSPISRGSEP